MNIGMFHTAPDHSNGLYIAMLYFVILDRDLDQSGYNFWLGTANSGGVGRLFQGLAGYPMRIQILGPVRPAQGFAGSPEFQGLYQWPGRPGYSFGGTLEVIPRRSATVGSNGSPLALALC